MKREQYLGDGVYATWEDGIITLDLRAQDPTHDNRIVLEPEVFQNLINFERSCKEGESQ